MKKYLLFPFLTIILGCNETSKTVVETSQEIKPHKYEFNIDSLLKNTDEKSYVFLNYPNFISEKIYDTITKMNIKNKKIFIDGNKDMTEFPYGIKIWNTKIDIDLKDGITQPFGISPNFIDGKLFSINLFNRLYKFDADIETIEKQVKNIYDDKYGNPTKKIIDVVNHEKGIAGSKLLTKNSYNKLLYDSQEKTSENEYKYSNKDRIVVLTISKGSKCEFELNENMLIPTKGKRDEEWPFIGISIDYYTKQSYEIVQDKNKTEEDRMKKTLESKFKVTKKDL
jgi:hypothetical protein